MPADTDSRYRSVVADWLPALHFLRSCSPGCVAFQMFAGRMSQPMLRLVGQWQEFQQANIAVKRLNLRGQARIT